MSKGSKEKRERDQVYALLSHASLHRPCHLPLALSQHFFFILSLVANQAIKKNPHGHTPEEYLSFTVNFKHMIYVFKS